MSTAGMGTRVINVTVGQTMSWLRSNVISMLLVKDRNCSGQCILIPQSSSPYLQGECLGNKF
ncbi:MAG: hypothetical protein CLLPBCKN_008058 [Chroococcidiopsis cubana SAG 39.79]|nr:hypothetical protein [Chroococcidiopsis cubana SAG 39.79]